MKFKNLIHVFIIAAGVVSLVALAAPHPRHLVHLNSNDPLTATDSLADEDWQYETAVADSFTVVEIVDWDGDSYSYSEDTPVFVEEFEDSVWYADSVSVAEEDYWVEDSALVEEEDPFDYMEEVNWLAENPYIKDKEAVLSFRIARKAGSMGLYYDAARVFNTLKKSGYPMAKYMADNYEKYFKMRDAYEKYESEGMDCLTGEELLSAADFLNGSDRQAAIKCYEAAFRKGEAKAASELALLYYSGTEVGFLSDENRRLAVEWTKKGVEAGDSYSIFCMGIFHEEGMIMPYDMAEAARFYQAGADKDQINCLNNLRAMYIIGLGVDADIDKAKELRYRAAKAGHANCAASLAREAVKGGRYQEAYEWLRLATENGSSDIYLQLIDLLLSSPDTPVLASSKEATDFLKVLFNEGVTSTAIDDEDYIINITTILDLVNADWSDLQDRAMKGDRKAKKFLVWDALYGIKSKKNFKEACRRAEGLALSFPEYNHAVGKMYLENNVASPDLMKAQEYLSRCQDNYLLHVEKIKDAVNSDDDDLFEEWKQLCCSPLQITDHHRCVECFFEEDDPYAPILEEIRELENLLSRKDDIIQKASKKDPEALFQLWKLSVAGLYDYEPAPDLAMPSITLLAAAAHLGNTEAMTEYARYFQNMHNTPAYIYWDLKSEGSNPFERTILPSLN